MNENPSVSIILPTYNRESFLESAFGAIRDQTFTDWELIVVDDGSTDQTREKVDRLTSEIRQPVRYIYQENEGAYGARNTGLDHACGKHIAFYDSDDTWLPHHLQDCVQALEDNSDVDWVYGSCSIREMDSGKEISPSSFYVDGSPRPFMQLATEERGKLRVITDESAAECQLQFGLFSGLQNSVMRAKFFEHYRFESALRNEAEDQIVVVRAILAGYRFAYFDNVHVDYHIHAENSSAVGSGGGIKKKIRVVRAMIEGFEELLDTPQLPIRIQRAIKRRLGREYFWNLGYSLYWQSGIRDDARTMYYRGLTYWPWDWRCWKTLLVSRLRRS